MNRFALMTSSAFAPMILLASGLCSMAAEGQEDAGGGASAEQVGGTTRVTVGNDGAADAAATAAATSSGAEPPKSEDTPKEEAKAEDTPKGEDTPKEEPKPAPVIPDDPRFEPFTQEFTESGTLKPESIGAAAKAFLGEDNDANRTVVETYLKGLQGTQAEATVQATPFHEAAGGAEAFATFQAWTGEEGNMSPAEESAYMTLLNSGKTEEALAVLQPVLSRWKAAGGGAPARDVTNGAGGGGAGSEGGEVYANWAQVQVDMANPKYETDSAFRAQVEQKLGRSTF